MKDVPAEVSQVIEEVSQQFKDDDDLSECVKEACRRVRALPTYQSFVDQLACGEVQELVYALRHKINVRIKRQSGYFGKKGKVNGVCGEVIEAYQSVYDYCIGGRILGNLMGSDLLSIAAQEEEIGKGHKFNAELCRWLRAKVSDNQKVRDVIPEKTLRKNFDRIKKEVYEAVA